MISILLFDLLTFLLLFVLFFFIFSSSCLHSYYFTVIFSKIHFFSDTWVFLTLLVYYSCTQTQSIHSFTRLVYCCLVCCCYCLSLTIFCIIMEKHTFSCHLSISDCCWLLYTFFCLTLFDSYTSIWSVSILVIILIVFLHLFF